MKPVEIIKVYKADKAEKKVVQHCDVFKLDVGTKFDKTDEGYLSGSAPVAKVGVMAYLMADGSIIREFVPPETLFDAASMVSLKMKPMTDNHPSERVVDSDNAGYRQIGWTGEKVVADSNFLISNMLITDGWTIDNIEDGQQELSPGYEAELVFQKGEFNGDEYDAIQVSRKYNHLAVVDNARGGNDIRMQLDNADEYGYEKVKKNDSNQPKPKKEKKMPIFKIDGIDYEASQEVINHITKQDQKITAMETEAATNKTTIDTVTADRDTLKVKVDEIDKVDNKKVINDAVQARIALVTLANNTLEKADGIEELSDRELKIKIIDSKLPEIIKKIDEKTTDVYIDAVLDTISTEVKKDDGDNNVAAQRQTTTSKQDASIKTDEDTTKVSREKMNEDSQNAWKGEKSENK